MLWVLAVAVGSAVAVGVYETGCDAFVRRASPPGGERVSADRLAGGREPLFPLVRALRFTVGVQQQPSTERASAVLGSEEPQRGGVHRRVAAAAPLGPVVGQGRVIG